MTNHYNAKNAQNKEKKCFAGQRCGLFKKCETCNKIRQARLCDITELAGRFSPRATYAVMMPFNQAQNQETVKKLKTNLTRKLRKSTNGILTSIETSANDALHLNLIINHEKPLNLKPFQTIAKNLNAEVDIFLESINKKDLRRVTAYALKKQSIPTKEQYEGNTLNLSGNLRTMKEILQSKRMIKSNPLVAITSMCNTLIKLGLEPPDEALIKQPRLQRSLENLMYLTKQVKELNVCYSETRGILTRKEFEKIYNRKLGQCKKDITRKKQNMLWDNRWRKLPKNISLKDHLEGKKPK